ncbi:hypothetical protein [Sulfurihydrogenibium sp.]|jgi:hypothetical protein|uniref:hypothetical protein n=1 Tax=Sulfurihydrogenibium sp. TaxID=2053621 RepID=UPI002618BDA3|nr:hypothetical protein [Sulfurihydrogenibium sp.]
MKKLVVMFTFFPLLSGIALAEDENKQSECTKKCEKVCVQWEERRDCLPDPDPVLQRDLVFQQICGVYKTCVKYEEICIEDR